MLPQKIGNWEVTSEGIVWRGEGRYPTITVDRLTESGPPGERATMYDWLVHMAEKSWLTEKDIYALNTALIYAIEAHGQRFTNDLSFVDTFKEQQRIITRHNEY